MGIFNPIEGDVPLAPLPDSIEGATKDSSESKPILGNWVRYILSINAL